MKHLGEAKTCHGLHRARYRVLATVKRQIILTAVAINLKRLAAPLGRRRSQAIRMANRAGKDHCTAISALICLRKSLTGLWAVMTAILTPVLLGGRDATVHA